MVMNKLFYFFSMLCFVFANQIVYSQANYDYKICGVVRDMGQYGVPFANVTLYDFKGKILSSDTTDIDGNYSINVNFPNKEYMTATAIGYSIDKIFIRRKLRGDIDFRIALGSCHIVNIKRKIK